MHNHSDYTILVEPRAESMIRQGVTTMVLGESRSAAPIKAGTDEPRARADGVTIDWTTLGGYFAKLEKQHVATNIASYVGEEQVWTYVKGYSQSPATPAELQEMKRLIAQAMEEGAMGLSTALLQPPSSFATTADLIELAKTAKQYGGIYSSHIRDEGEGVFRAIDEAIQVGKGARIPVDIIHMKIAHQRLWGRAKEIVAMVQKARDEGHDIRANVYPYTAGQNNLSSIVPPWAHDGGREKMLERLKDPAARKRMRDEVMNGLPDWYNHYLATGDGWGGMILVSLRHERNKRFQGRRMSELIQARGGHPADVLFDVLIEENGSVPTVFFHHSEADMQLIMKQSWTSIGSDGSAVNPDGPTGRTHPHPRYYGTFPRVLGRYVRELKVISLPDAVKKMTSMNADKIGIKDRGRLKEGQAADVTIFAADRVIDRATFEQPHQFPVGIEYVIVNGQVTIDRGQHTGALAGQVIRGPGTTKSQEARAQMIRLGEVLVLTPSDGKPAPDANDHLLQADRGNRKGQFYRAWTGGATAGTPPATDRSTTYQLLSPETVGPLPEIDVLGIHFTKVLPERREAFERFVRDTLHPAVANLRPDLRLLYYKATGGPEAPGYILVFALTKESRDKYWPGGSDSDALRAAFGPVKVHTKELNSYLVPGSALTDEKFAAAIYESREWTDLVLVPSGSR
jgi:N-acyl-D-amino-acid deacylase